MDDLLEVVSPETNEFWDSRKTAFAGRGIWGVGMGLSRAIYSSKTELAAQMFPVVHVAIY